MGGRIWLLFFFYKVGKSDFLPSPIVNFHLLCITFINFTPNTFMITSIAVCQLFYILLPKSQSVYVIFFCDLYQISLSKEYLCIPSLVPVGKRQWSSSYLLNSLNHRLSVIEDQARKESRCLLFQIIWLIMNVHYWYISFSMHLQF